MRNLSHIAPVSANQANHAQGHFRVRRGSAHDFQSVLQDTQTSDSAAPADQQENSSTRTCTRDGGAPQAKSLFHQMHNWSSHSAHHSCSQASDSSGTGSDPATGTDSSTGPPGTTSDSGSTSGTDTSSGAGDTASTSQGADANTNQLLTELIAAVKALNPASGSHDSASGGSSDVIKLLTQLIDTVQGLKTALTPGNSSATPPTQSLQPGSLSFAAKLPGEVKGDTNNRVSEVELRRGVVLYQLYQKDTQLADSFQGYYKTAIDSGSDPATALKSALNQIVSAGKLGQADANWVYSLSATAAHFESGQAELSSTTSGAHGLDSGAALKFAEATLAGIQAGKVKVASLTLKDAGTP